MAWSAYVRSGVFFSLTAALFLGSGCGTTGQRAMAPVTAEPLVLDSEQSDFAEALAHFGTGIIREGLRDPGAISNYTRAVQLAPDQLAPALFAASTLLKSGDYEQAVETLENFCANNPDSMESRLWLGRFALQAAGLHGEDGAYKALAESAFREAVEIAPRHEDGYLHLASFYAAASSQSRAFAVLDEAAEKLDNPVNALRMKADMLLDRFLQSGEKDVELLNKAIAVLERAKTCPRDELTDAYLQKLAESYGLTAKGAEIWLELYANNPGELGFARKAGAIFDEIGEDQRAVAAFEIAVRHDTGLYPEIYHRLAELYLESGSIEAAVSVCEKASKIYPEDTGFYIRLAQVYLVDDVLSAIAVIEKGLEKNPDSVALLEFLATLHVRNGQADQAFDVYNSIHSVLNASTNMFPSAMFFLNYGMAAEASENYEKALEMYRKAISMEPDMNDAYLRAALVYVRLANKPAAMAMMEIMLAADREDPAGLYYLGIVNNRLERYDKALEAFSKSEALSCELDEAGLLAESAFYFNYGAAAERTGNFDKAERLFRESIALDKNNHEALNYLAYMWAEQDANLDEALMFVERALDAVPGNGAYLDTLGWIYYKQGRYEEALEKILEAFELIPDDPIMAEHTGDVYKALDNTEKAVEYWEISYNKEPGNEAVKKKLFDAGVSFEEAGE